MNAEELIRIWKDESYRESVPLASAEPHPSGLIELTDEELALLVAASEIGADIPIGSCGWLSCGDEPPRQ